MAKPDQADFDRKLIDFVAAIEPEDLLAIPGIREILADRWNSDIVRELEEDRQEAAERLREEDRERQIVR